MISNKPFSKTLKKLIANSEHSHFHTIHDKSFSKTTELTIPPFKKTTIIEQSKNPEEKSLLELAVAKRTQQKKLKVDRTKQFFFEMKNSLNRKLIASNKKMKTYEEKKNHIKQMKQTKNMFNDKIDEIMEDLANHKEQFQVNKPASISMSRPKNYRIISEPTQQCGNPNSKTQSQFLNIFEFMLNQKVEKQQESVFKNQRSMSKVNCHMNSGQIAKNNKQMLAYKRSKKDIEGENVRDAKDHIKQYRAGMTSLRNINYRYK